MSEELLMICPNCKWVGHIFDCDSNIEENRICCPICKTSVDDLYEKVEIREAEMKGREADGEED